MEEISSCLRQVRVRPIECSALIPPMNVDQGMVQAPQAEDAKHGHPRAPIWFLCTWACSKRTSNAIRKTRNAKTPGAAVGTAPGGREERRGACPFESAGSQEQCWTGTARVGEGMTAEAVLQTSPSSANGIEILSFPSSSFGRPPAPSPEGCLRFASDVEPQTCLCVGSISCSPSSSHNSCIGSTCRYAR